MKKKILIAIVSTGLFFTLFAVSFISLRNHIYNRKDCERFNIDNLESRAHVNIPDVKDGDCKCDGKIKESSFTLDIDDDRVQNYLRKNGFEKVSDYYQKKGINEDTKWDVVFTPDNKKLSFVVEYLD